MAMPTFVNHVVVCVDLKYGDGHSLFRDLAAEKTVFSIMPARPPRQRAAGMIAATPIRLNRRPSAQEKGFLLSVTSSIASDAAALCPYASLW